MHYNPDGLVITSTHFSCKGVGVTAEEGPHVVEALLLGFSHDHREGLVWKICDFLVNGECHHFDVKGSNFGAFGCVI